MTSASDGHHVGLTRCLDKHGPVTDAPKAKIKIDTFSKLGFVHRRSVFEPPEPKVDYLYYVFGTLEIIILVKGDETIAT